MVTNKRPRDMKKRPKAPPLKRAKTFNSLTMPQRPRVGPERKFNDERVGGSAIPFTTAGTPGVWGTQQLLNAIDDGTTSTTRIGGKILMKSIYLRCNCYMGATTTGGGQVRLLCVYDRQPNAALATVTSIVETDSMISPNNLSNRDRFVTIFDELTEPVSAVGSPNVSHTIYRKLNLETVFNTGSAGTIADITTGALIFLWAGAGFQTANAQIDWSTRLRFTDV